MQITLDAGGDDIHPIAEQAAQADGAVALKGGDVGGGHFGTG
ncbi:hypothetical protein [Chromobacterium sp. Beijing]|nr:hypothetical protein [Chromobacterium sp. Beijing]